MADRCIPVFIEVVRPNSVRFCPPAVIVAWPYLALVLFCLSQGFHLTSTNIGYPFFCVSSYRDPAKKGGFLEFPFEPTPKKGTVRRGHARRNSHGFRSLVLRQQSLKNTSIRTGRNMRPLPAILCSGHLAANEEAEASGFVGVCFSEGSLVGALDWWFGFGFEPQILVEGKQETPIQTTD